jgi:hypothetical protein
VKRSDTKKDEEAIRYMIGRRLKSAAEVETMDAHPMKIHFVLLLRAVLKRRDHLKWFRI